MVDVDHRGGETAVGNASRVEVFHTLGGEGGGRRGGEGREGGGESEGEKALGE